jgi:predicted amidohydrolase
VRVGVLICGDVWRPDLVMELCGSVDLICIATKTTVPDASHTEYARRLWHNLALTRAMENGLPVVVADWAEGRHESVALVDGRRVKSVHCTSGGSSITDPSRRPHFDQLQQRISTGGPGLLAGAIDLDAMAAFRDYRRSIGLLPDE